MNTTDKIVTVAVPIMLLVAAGLMGWSERKSPRYRSVRSKRRR
jgi:hypothetical protein